MKDGTPLAIADRPHQLMELKRQAYNSLVAVAAHCESHPEVNSDQLIGQAYASVIHEWAQRFGPHGHSERRQIQAAGDNGLDRGWSLRGGENRRTIREYKIAQRKIGMAHRQRAQGIITYDEEHRIILEARQGIMGEGTANMIGRHPR